MDMNKDIYYLSDTDVPEEIQFLRDIKISNKRRVWWRFMKKYDVQSICELGVFGSTNFLRMIESNPKIAVGVDLWLGDGNPATNDSNFSQEVLGKQCQFFQSIMQKNSNVRLYRDYTHNAVKNFPDEYFDLIYIDADHTYEGCMQDLIDWYPKVKKGKFFTGDDYTNSRAPLVGVQFGVVPAVNDFAKERGLKVYELTRHGWAIIKE